MEIIYSKKITKDVKGIKDKNLIQKITIVIHELKKVDKVSQIKNLKKMKGKTNNAYRIRIGEYRLGFFEENGSLVLARLVKRNDIYKVFP